MSENIIFGILLSTPKSPCGVNEKHLKKKIKFYSIIPQYPLIQLTSSQKRNQWIQTIGSYLKIQIFWFFFQLIRFLRKLRSLCRSTHLLNKKHTDNCISNTTALQLQKIYYVLY